MSSESDTGECTAHDKQSNGECDCTEYVEADDSPGFCGNCYHRRHHHLHTKPNASKKNPAVKSLLADILGRSSDTGAKVKGGSKSKMSLGALVAASSSKFKSSALSAAHREANQGMRPTSESGSTATPRSGPPRRAEAPRSGPSGERQGGSAGAGAAWDSLKLGQSHSHPSGIYSPRKGRLNGQQAKQEFKKKRLFRVVSVQVLPCGTVDVSKDGARQLPQEFNKVPDRIQTQTAQLDNLAVVDSQGIVFDRDASHEEIEEQLTELLPLPFHYFARRQRESGKRPWFLAKAPTI
ncbi:hypothetical protein B0H12DRAFT_1082246 [Mycena haematopus]|nr:hypothetical protein B0H12DRAFT_1082246 [Mycena haematopus]